MRYIAIVLAGLLAVLPLASEAKQPSCGHPPRVDDQSLKGDLEGKAKFLSSLVGDAGLKGQFETARTDILSKYPNADKTRSKAYLQYMLCSFVLSDPKLSAQEKFRAIQEFRQAGSQSPQSSSISTKGAQSPAVESKGDTNIGYGAAPPSTHSQPQGKAKPTPNSTTASHPRQHPAGDAPPAPASSQPPAGGAISTEGSQSPAVRSGGNVGIQYGTTPPAAPPASGTR
jgi:hypothetical protein